jgi:hypothetical protein
VEHHRKVLQVSFTNHLGKDGPEAIIFSRLWMRMPDWSLEVSICTSVFEGACFCPLLATYWYF